MSSTVLNPPFLGPAHVDFDFTNACNLGCRHCHSASGKQLPGELSTAEVIDAMSALHRLGVMTVTIAGGEPFVRRDAIEILEYACSLPGWTVTVVTNATLLSSDTLAELKSRCPTLRLNISIDGSTPERFGRLRHFAVSTARSQRRLYDRVTDTARAAVSAGLPVQINFTLARATADDIYDTYALALDDIGADGLLAIKFFPAGYGVGHLDALEFPYTEWAPLFVALTRTKLRGDLPALGISVSSPWEFYLPLRDAGDIDLESAERTWSYRSPLRESTYAAADGRIGDTAGIAHLAVAGDGTVYPAILMAGSPRMACGTLRDESLEDIWFESATLGELRDLRSDCLATPCQMCAELELCGGGSRARAVGIAGGLLAADPMCPRVSYDEARA